MSRRLTGFVVLVALAAFIMGAGTLLYSDDSPGALPYRKAWEGFVNQTPSARPLVLVTDPNELACNLAEGDWQRVILAAKYAPGAPSYAGSLARFAERHPDALIHLFYWHSNGVPTTPDTAVTATASVYLWRGNTTTCAYSDAPGYSGSAVTLPGLIFPDFAGITPRDPFIAVQAPPEVVERASVPELIIYVLNMLGKDCAELCRTAYIEQLDTCSKSHQGSLAQCNYLYGPGLDPNNPVGDPNALAACIKDVNEEYTNCVNGAVRQYNRCLAVCKKQQQQQN